MPLGQPAELEAAGPAVMPRTLAGSAGSAGAGPAERIVTMAHRADTVLVTPPASASGAASVQLPAPPAGQFYVIDRLMVATASFPTTPVSFVLAAGEFNPAAPAVDFWQTVIEVSRYGGLDGADYPHGLIVPAGRPLTFAWMLAPVGDRCYARPQYRICRTEGP